jgi:hypothetical protein
MHGIACACPLAETGGVLPLREARDRARRRRCGQDVSRAGHAAPEATRDGVGGSDPIDGDHAQRSKARPVLDVAQPAREESSGPRWVVWVLRHADKSWGRGLLLVDKMGVKLITPASGWRHMIPPALWSKQEWWCEPLNPLTPPVGARERGPDDAPGAPALWRVPPAPAGAGGGVSWWVHAPPDTVVPCSRATPARSRGWRQPHQCYTPLLAPSATPPSGGSHTGRAPQDGTERGACTVAVRR